MLLRTSVVVSRLALASRPPPTASHYFVRQLTTTLPRPKDRKPRMTESVEPATKRQKTEEYVLYYWPGIPGRGEFVRLAFEYAGQPYTESLDPPTFLSTLTNPSISGSIPPHFAPPALKLPSGRLVSQTGAILNHVAPKFGLAGSKGSKLGKRGAGELDEKEREEAEEERTIINQLVLTGMDLCAETHDTHHPSAPEKYYEDQLEAAKECTKSYRAFRLPKYFKHFQNVLATNKEGQKNGGTYLVGASTTTADLVLYQLVDGISFAFPRRIAALKASGEYDDVFALWERVSKEKGIKEYIASGRKQGYSNGIFRHYEELDGDE